VSALLGGDVRRGEVGRDGGRHIRWIEAGAGRPAVVLVAGAGETCLDWTPVLPDLVPLGRVVAYDRAGLGASDPSARPSVEASVDDLAAVLDAVGPAVVVGHSWGGLLAELVAWAHPRQVRGLVLLDPSHEDVMGAAPGWQVAMASAMLGVAVLAKRMGLLGRVIRRMGRALAAQATADEPTRALIEGAYVASYRTVASVRTIRAENRLLDTAAPSIRAARAPLPDVPVTVLTATRGKPPQLLERSTQLAESVAQSAPRGRHVPVTDSGHYIHHDQPAEVVRVVADTLARVEE